MYVPTQLQLRGREHVCKPLSYDAVVYAEHSLTYSVTGVTSTYIHTHTHLLSLSLSLSLSLFMKVFLAFAMSASAVTFGLGGGPADVCWKDSYGRGVGEPISACNASKGLEKSGWLCYPKCKEADPSYYGVGPVCWQHCKPGYVDEGALCRKDGSIITYAKSSYGRGAGYPLTCAAGLVEDAALCYKPCRSGFYGVGPVCWEDCTKVDPVSGGAVCCSNGTVCSEKIKDLAGGLPLA
jgi:hypothetical protein